MQISTSSKSVEVKRQPRFQRCVKVDTFVLGQYQSQSRSFGTNINFFPIITSFEIVQFETEPELQKNLPTKQQNTPKIGFEWLRRTGFSVNSAYRQELH